MPPSVRQTNFSAGELSPMLWGRTDLPIFHAGLRTCRNFFISRHGAAVSRPGTTYVASAKVTQSIGGFQVPTSFDRVRLVRFVAAADASFVLCFGHYYLRFYTQGGTVLDAGGNVYERATPYTVDELADLKFAQSGDVLTICSPNHPAYELTHLAAADWTLVQVSYVPPVARFADVSAAAPGTTGFILCNDLGGGFTAPGGQQGDADHPAREWQWLFTALLKSVATGAIIESLPQTVTETMSSVIGYDGSKGVINSPLWAVYPDRAFTFQRSDTAGLIGVPADAAQYVVVGYNAYRGRGGLWGFLGTTTSRSFVDVGDEPDYTIQPPLGTAPFATDADGGRPLAVSFFQDRRVFGGSKLRPSTVRTSETGDYYNFDSRLLIHSPGEALEFTLASRVREEIRGLLTRQRLLVFTSVGVWSVGGSQGSPIDFSDIDARVEDETGAEGLQPIVADGIALYVRAKGVGVRALVTDGQQYSYRGTDVSMLAQHLFLGANRTIVDWCYAQDPWGVVWAVRGDGVLLSLTHDGESIAWARHDTDGYVESVCSVPEGDEDAVYLSVVRTIQGTQLRYIERMTSRVRRYQDTDADPSWPQLYPDKLSIDCALEYSKGPSVVSFTGLDVLEGKQVYVVARKMDPVGPFTVVNGQISNVYSDLPPPNAVDAAGKPIFVAHVGLLFTAQLETLDVAAGEARMRKKTVERIGFECDESIGLMVGQSLDPNDLEEWIQRDVDADGFNAVSAATVLVDMAVQSNIDQSARAALQQSMPLPVTVVGLTREVSIGE